MEDATISEFRLALATFQGSFTPQQSQRNSLCEIRLLIRNENVLFENTNKLAFICLGRAISFSHSFLANCINIYHVSKISCCLMR